MGLTFFTISRPFTGEWNLIQSNSLKSWRLLGPDKIMLFRQPGFDKGIVNAAKKFGCEHHTMQLHKKFGVPIIQNVFDRAQLGTNSKTMCFLHAEMILMDDFRAAVELVSGRFDHFLMIGRRWGWKITEPIDFSVDWQAQLRERAKTAKLYGRAGLSVFVFNRWLYRQGEVVRAMIGRGGEDIWLSSYVMQNKNVPVIDATLAVMMIHQNHAGGMRRNPKETEYNDRLVGDVSKGLTSYATWELTKDMRLRKRKVVPKRIKWYGYNKNGKEVWRRKK